MSTFPPTPPQNGYITLPVTVSTSALIKAAIASIQQQIPGWVPQEGQLDVVILEECAQMASVATATAAQMTTRIFEYFGSLVGVTPIKGVAATAPVKFTMRTTAGATIPAGTVVAYPLSANQQVLFTLKTPVVIASGHSTGTGTLVCRTVGTFANGLAAATCQMVTSFAQVTSVATTAATSGGINADTEASYLNRLTAELQLLAPRPILATDYAAISRNVTGVYRALAINGLSPGRSITGAATTASSKTLTCAAGNFTSLDVGRSITGTNIPATTTISAVTNSTTVTLSKTATATGTGIAITLGDLRTQQRCVTVCGLATTGTALSTAVTAALLAYLKAKREVTFLVSTIKPTYTSIDVSVTVVPSLGQTPAVVQSAVAAAITKFLNPAYWGGGTAQLPAWASTTTKVRYLDLANVIHSVAGVLFISTLKLCVHGGTLGTADVTLSGDGPLPRAGTISVTA